MQTTVPAGMITGIFIRELKNRFLCEVIISGEPVVCYVPSSCHLSNFLQLEGKPVLLVPTASPKSRTQYALFAVPFKRNYIVLNTSMANRAVESSIKSRRFSYLGQRNKVLKEHVISGYKSDLYIEDTNTVIEIKSVISTDAVAEFPTVYSERTLQQFEDIERLLSEKKHVVYCIVSLSPYVRSIHIDSDSSFYISLMKCLHQGMTMKAYSIQLCDNGVSVKSEIPLIYKEHQ